MQSRKFSIYFTNRVWKDGFVKNTDVPSVDEVMAMTKGVIQYRKMGNNDKKLLTKHQYRGKQIRARTEMNVRFVVYETTILKRVLIKPKLNSSK